MDQKKKILVIDDDPETIDMVKLAVEESDRSVIATAEPEEGLNLAKTEQPDVIIVDVSAPEKNGFDLLKELKEYPETHGIPVLMLSADEGGKKKGKARLQRSDGFLSKPLDVSRLMKTVDRLAAHHTPAY